MQFIIVILKVEFSSTSKMPGLVNETLSRAISELLSLKTIDDEFALIL